MRVTPLLVAELLALEQIACMLYQGARPNTVRFALPMLRQMLLDNDPIILDRNVISLAKIRENSRHCLTRSANALANFLLSDSLAHH
jgi:hypothetical protein